MTKIEVPKLKLNSQYQIPILGFGTYGLTNPVQSVLDAVKVGYRLFDTAEMYGNEKEVGQGLNQALADHLVSRSDLFVTTKVSPSHVNYQGVKNAFAASLKKLNLKYIDLYLIHWPTSDEQNLGAWKAMEELVSAGKIRSIGVSNFSENDLKYLIDNSKTTPAVNQVEYNPGLNKETLRSFCQNQGIVMEAWSPLSRGAVSGNATLKSLAQKYQKTSAQIDLRWLTQKGIVVIPKSDNSKRRKENFQLFNFQLKKEELAKIDQL